MTKGRQKGRQKGGRGIAVVALIFGIFGLALGGYSFFLLQTSNVLQPGVRLTGVWYRHYDYFYPITDTDTQIPNMSLSISVNEGDNVSILFTGTLSIQSTEVPIRIHHDGEFSLLEGYGYYIEDLNNPNEVSISIQQYLTDLPAGDHNITVWGTKSTVGSAAIAYCTLLVQSYSII